MKLNEPFISELKIEAVNTRKLLERVPQDFFSWRPHLKSRSLGEISAHIANLPGIFIANLDRDYYDRNEYQASIENIQDILLTFDKNISRSLEVLNAMSDEQMLLNWIYKYGEKVIFELPRFVVIRTTALNHLFHHRGQLSVYLRLLEISLPAIYGPTADEN